MERFISKLLLNNSNNFRGLKMGSNLEYRTSVLEKCSGKSLRMKESYRGGNLFHGYLPIRGLDSLEASYSVGMFELERYLRTITNYANNYPSSASGSYSVESRSELKGYERATPESSRDLKKKCPECMKELDFSGACPICGWSPFHENVKKRNLYEQ